MPSLATTRMSSKGQVVIPEKIRHQLGFSAGQEFVVVGKRDVVILKSVKPISLSGLEGLLARSRGLARKYGLKKKDLAAAIAKVRGRR